MRYRRSKTPGATYFFTVVTYRRRSIFHCPETIDLLRESFRTVKQKYPFEIDAIAVLPDHLHCLWTLPADDANFSLRWRRIKSDFTCRCPGKYKGNVSAARQRKGEQSVWQRRFWEHQIRDEVDFENHVDYIHYNPVKHGLVDAPKDWLPSSFHRYVEYGIYPIDWGQHEAIEFGNNIGFE